MSQSVTRNSRFKDIEWWIVPKRLIYLLIALLILGILAGGFGVYAWINGNPFKNVGADAPLVNGARFDSFEGDVRVVRANTRETISARRDTRLLPGDIVQTQEDGRARISLADGSTLIVKPNSVITIAENTSDEKSGRTNVRVAVDSGQAVVRTEHQPAGTSNVVKTRLTESRVAGETNASFGVREDNTEDIRVSSGAIETSTRGGEKTTVTGGSYVAINPAGSIAKQEKLLDIPAPATPRNLEKIPVREGGAASVSLRWQRPVSGSPAHYRVEVANSPFFVVAGKVIERDQLDVTQFDVRDLRPGNYFWRVRAVATSGQISEWSDPQKFLVVAATGGGDPLTVTNVAFEYVAGNIYIMRGRTQPGNTIRIAGRDTLAALDGSFKLQFTSPRETREITVEAEDPQGNRNSFRFPFNAK